MEIEVNLKEFKYKIIIEKGILKDINKSFSLECKYLILTDDGVPKQYLDEVKQDLKNVEYIILKQGEETKSLRVYKEIMSFLINNHYSRNDVLIALGGGVISDLTGFVAATFKRGMRYINIPTTTLSMIDASCGGKTAINFEGTKNVIGTFYHPQVVYIDIDVLKTLPERHINNGLVEALKAGLIRDKKLYDFFKKDDVYKYIEDIIYYSLKVKSNIVMEDEKESGSRRLLNYGHTFGHAIESYYEMKDLLHGEAVALGMLLISKKEVYYQELLDILKKLNMPLEKINNIDKTRMFYYIQNDKKIENESIYLVLVHEIGKGVIKKINTHNLLSYME